MNTVVATVLTIVVVFRWNFIMKTSKNSCIPRNTFARLRLRAHPPCLMHTKFSSPPTANTSLPLTDKAELSVGGEVRIAACETKSFWSRSVQVRCFKKMPNPCEARQARSSKNARLGACDVSLTSFRYLSPHLSVEIVPVKAPLKIVSDWPCFLEAKKSHTMKGGKNESGQSLHGTDFYPKPPGEVAGDKRIRNCAQQTLNNLSRRDEVKH